MTEKPLLNLWVFNHEFRAITDQVEFFSCLVRAHGYDITISRRPSLKALNILIEHMTAPSVYRVVNDFCHESGKRIAMMLTEHIDFDGTTILFHGKTLDEDHPYMRPRKQRLHYLASLADVTSMYLTLGDLPEMLGFDRWLPQVRLYRLPYPTVDRFRVAPQSSATPAYDVIFTGALTGYRADVIALLRQNYEINSPEPSSNLQLKTRSRRDAITMSGAVNLNIPQNTIWPWVSFMRVLAALKCMRPTVSIVANEPAKLQPFFATIPSEDIACRLAPYVKDYAVYARTFLDRYNDFARSSANFAFPHGAIELWADIEL